MFGVCMWYVQMRMEPDIVGTDVVSALQETCIKVLGVFDRMLFCENTKTEYVVIRWYNDCKALVLFTGWEPFYISLLWGREAVMDVVSEILDMIGDILELVITRVIKRKKAKNERSKEKQCITK